MAVSGLMQKGVPPTQPAFLRILKIVIIVLSVIVLALAAYSLSIFGSAIGYYGNSGPAGLLIFDAIKTWIILGVALFLELRAPHLFWRIILVIAYFISIIFWLSGWAWAASWAALFLAYDNDYDYNCSYDSNGNLNCGDSDYAPWKHEGGALAGAAAIGAIIWVLLIVHLVFFVISCLRDPQGSAPTQQQAELGQVKAQEASYAPQPAYQQPQPGYQQPQSGYQHPQEGYQQPHPQQQPYAAQ